MTQLLKQSQVKVIISSQCAMEDFEAIRREGIGWSTVALGEMRRRDAALLLLESCERDLRPAELGISESEEANGLSLLDALVAHPLLSSISCMPAAVRWAAKQLADRTVSALLEELDELSPTDVRRTVLLDRHATPELTPAGSVVGTPPLHVGKGGGRGGLANPKPPALRHMNTAVLSRQHAHGGNAPGGGGGGRGGLKQSSQSIDLSSSTSSFASAAGEALTPSARAAARSPHGGVPSPAEQLRALRQAVLQAGGGRANGDGAANAEGEEFRAELHALLATLDGLRAVGDRDLGGVSNSPRARARHLQSSQHWQQGGGAPGGLGGSPSHHGHPHHPHHHHHQRAVSEPHRESPPSMGGRCLPPAGPPSTASARWQR